MSKSTLRMAINEICTSSNHHYFPAYEIMQDDLRDYRFYADDLVHPNQLAIRYIWEQFSAVYFSDSTIALNQQIASLNQSIAHKAFNEESDQHQQFLRKLINELEKIQQQEGIRYNDELASLRSQLLD